MLGQNEVIEPVPMNVKEDFTLFDSIMVYKDLADLGNHPPGWFTSFAAMSNANTISFFDMRNMGSCDRAYCNQDTRDQTAFAMLIEQIGVRFWGPGLQFQATSPDGFGLTIDQIAELAWWEGELAQHTSVRFRVNQDEKLKAPAIMLPPGCGPVGSGYGNMGAIGAGGSTRHSPYQNVSQGVAHVKDMWPFPMVIEIPRRASISVQLELAEYAKQVLRTMPGPGYYAFPTPDSTAAPTNFFGCAYGISVTIKGKRLVQQRGQLHA